MEEQVFLNTPSKKPPLSFKTVAHVLGLLLLLLVMPIGSYLALSQTTFFSKAAPVVPKPSKPQANLIMETPKVSVKTGEVIPVEILVRSDLDEANLFSAKFNYPPDLLQVESIATDSADFSNPNEEVVQKWVEVNIDNQSGQVSLVGGVPNPGFKSLVNSSVKHLLTTVTFKALKSGTARINFEEGSAIFRNTDQQNILENKQGLTINIVGDSLEEIALSEKIASSSAERISVLSPSGGEVFNYYEQIPVNWRAEGLENVTLGIQVNGYYLGQISPLIPNSGVYLWKAEESLPVSFINPYNTFQIEVSGVKKDGKVITGSSNGPFGITLKEVSLKKEDDDTVRVSIEESSDINQDSRVDLKDLSLLFANYNKTLDDKVARSDLNRDGGVNDIDLWYLMNFLIKNQVITI